MKELWKSLSGTKRENLLKSLGFANLLPLAKYKWTDLPRPVKKKVKRSIQQSHDIVNDVKPTDGKQVKG